MNPRRHRRDWLRAMSPLLVFPLFIGLLTWTLSASSGITKLPSPDYDSQPDSKSLTQHSMVQRPKIRAITAFVHIQRNDYQAQLQGAVQMLRTAKAAFQAQGYEVQTIRITTQAFPEYTRDLGKEEALAFLRRLDDLAVKEGFALCLGPALMTDSDDAVSIELLEQALSSATAEFGSIVVAGSDGIHWKAVSQSAKVVAYLAVHSPHGQGNFAFAATAMLGPYAPFYPGSYHTAAGHQFSIAVEAANVVAEVFRNTGHQPGLAAQQLKSVIAGHGAAIEKIARAVESQKGWAYMGVDLSPAPLGDVSIGAAIEDFLQGRFGSAGTMTAAAIITEAIRAAPVTKTGYSGLMLPVLEDSRLAERWSEGAFGMDALLAYSAVCGTGLDTIPLPGDVSQEQLARIIGDVATLAVKWNKPLSARLLPVAGKKAGQKTEFDDPRLNNAILQPLPY